MEEAELGELIPELEEMVEPTDDAGDDGSS
jgi:hypothetical protein